MQFYDVLSEVGRRAPLVADLLTGDPLLVDEVSAELSAQLGRLRSYHAIEDLLGAYRNYDGVPEFRDCLAERFEKVFGRSISPDQIIITPGVQSALRYLHAIIRERQLRLLYPVGLDFPGAYDDSSHLPPSTGTLPEIGDSGIWAAPSFNVAALDWDRVGAVILSRPHTPTGRVWPADEIVALGEESTRHGAFLVLDETYGLPFAPLTEGGVLTAADGPNFVHLFSFSKVGLAGERVGVVVAPPHLASAVRAQQRKNVIQPSKIGQLLAMHIVQLFENKPELGKQFGKLIRTRYDLTRKIMGAGPMKVANWEGGPFCWLYWHEGPSDTRVFNSLLQAGVAVAPASALGPPHKEKPATTERALRVAITRSEGELQRGLHLITNVFQGLCDRTSA
jgi:alanine-alpha-ketoisovalerate/valine-pyruvate aminotransferase